MLHCMSSPCFSQGVFGIIFIMHIFRCPYSRCLNWVVHFKPSQWWEIVILSHYFSDLFQLSTLWLNESCPESILFPLQTSKRIQVCYLRCKQLKFNIVTLQQLQSLVWDVLVYLVCSPAATPEENGSPVYPMSHLPAWCGCFREPEALTWH